MVSVLARAEGRPIRRVSAKRPAYSIVILLPNVTGDAYMGHVLNNTIQDILARKARMTGEVQAAGHDHAVCHLGGGREDAHQAGQPDRDDLGRTSSEKVGNSTKTAYIIEQLKKLGASAISASGSRWIPSTEVRPAVFVDLYRKG